MIFVVDDKVQVNTLKVVFPVGHISYIHSFLGSCLNHPLGECLFPVIVIDVLVPDEFPGLVIYFCGDSLKWLLTGSVPDEEAYRELSSDVIKRIGRNQK